MVEGMRKGADDQGAKKRKAKVGDCLRVDTSETEDDTDAVDLGGSQPSKQSNSSVTDIYVDSPHKIVSTPSDLFFGVAPPKVEKEPSQGREKKFSAKCERTEDTLQIGPTGKNTQLSDIGWGFLKVSSNVQDPVLQVYKSKRGQTNPLEVEKKKDKSKGSVRTREVYCPPKSFNGAVGIHMRYPSVTTCPLSFETDGGGQVCCKWHIAWGI